MATVHMRNITMVKAPKAGGTLELELESSLKIVRSKLRKAACVSVVKVRAIVLNACKCMKLECKTIPKPKPVMANINEKCLSIDATLNIDRMTVPNGLWNAEMYLSRPRERGIEARDRGIEARGEGVRSHRNSRRRCVRSKSFHMSSKK